MITLGQSTGTDCSDAKLNFLYFKESGLKFGGCRIYRSKDLLAEIFVVKYNVYFANNYLVKKPVWLPF